MHLAAEGCRAENGRGGLSVQKHVVFVTADARMRVIHVILASLGARMRVFYVILASLGARIRVFYVIFVDSRAFLHCFLHVFLSWKHILLLFAVPGSRFCRYLLCFRRFW